MLLFYLFLFSQRILNCDFYSNTIASATQKGWVGAKKTDRLLRIYLCITTAYCCIMFQCFATSMVICFSCTRLIPQTHWTGAYVYNGRYNIPHRQVICSLFESHLTATSDVGYHPHDAQSLAVPKRGESIYIHIESRSALTVCAYVCGYAVDSELHPLYTGMYISVPGWNNVMLVGFSATTECHLRSNTPRREDAICPAAAFPLRHKCALL